MFVQYSFICMYTHVRFIFIHVQGCVSERLHIGGVCVYIYVHTHIYAQTYIYVYTHICIHTYACFSKNISMYVCVCTCVCICDICVCVWEKF